MALASYGFVLAFFPLALAVLFAVARRAPGLRVPWLCLASLVFCALAGPRSLAVLLISSASCFAFARAIAERVQGGRRSGGLLACAIGVHIALLGGFKYTGFAAENLGWLLGTEWPALRIALPLGLSFITFQQIAYLVDAQRGEARGDRFADLLLLVSFFPKLAAGPIADRSSFLRELERSDFGRFSDANLVIGLTLIGVGLFKKVVIADELGECADAVFGAIAQGKALRAELAWLGALAYTLQLYFDFSGYSDMAIGAARCCGLRLPLNFYSPYQATSIGDFWRRWHITLGRFLTRYLYTPIAAPLTRWALARERSPQLVFAASVAVPTLVTFTLAGLWHGAGWTFVIFGLLHGIYLTAQQGWREARRVLLGRAPASRLRSLGSWALTFLAVVVAFVFFRAASVADALELLKAMLGARPDGLGLGGELALIETRDLRLVAAAAATAWLAPNAAQWLRPFEPALTIPKGDPPLPWPGRFAPGPLLALATALLWIAALGALGDVSDFLYYRF
jgi:alginate O-acetyltransferase complex protein AlgI